jgi:hypothetical protein
MVLHVFAGLDQLGTQALSAKIRPHKLLHMNDDVISQLGRPPLLRSSKHLLNIYSGQTPDIMEAYIRPNTVVAEKETVEDEQHRTHLPQHSSLPSTEVGPGSQFVSDIPDVSNWQTLYARGSDVETDGDLSNLHNKVRGQENVFGRADVAIEVLASTPTLGAISYESSDSIPATSVWQQIPPSYPKSLTASTSLTAQRSPITFHSSSAVSEALLSQSHPDRIRHGTGTP